MKIIEQNNMNYSKLLKNRTNVPVSVSFINSAPVKQKPLIKPLNGPQNYNEKDREAVEKWLSFCAIGTTIDKIPGGAF